MPSINNIASDLFTNIPFTFNSLKSPFIQPQQPQQTQAPSAPSQTNPYIQSNSEYDDNSQKTIVSSYEENPTPSNSVETYKSDSIQNGASEKTAGAVDIAMKEIGISEATGNNDGDILKYGGKEGDAWCASFVSYLYGIGQNNDNSDTFGYEIGVYELAQKAINLGYYSDEGEYEPVPGDVMIQQENGASHTGMVVKTDDEYVYTIEGNAGDAVRAKKYDKNGESYQKISGYIRMTEWTNGNAPPLDAPLENSRYEDADADKNQSTR